MRFAALGRTRWLYDGIRACASAGHEPTLIGTSMAAPEYSVTEADFEALAAHYGCDYFCDAAINSPSLVERLRTARADVAISVNWLTLIGGTARAAFPRGVLNAHAGDLPRYRGNAVPNWAILEGEPCVIATVHEMVDELDAGPIVLQRGLPLDETTYISDVYAFLDEAFPAMFAEALDGLEHGGLTPRAQSTDRAASLRCYPRRPSDGEIDWRQPAAHIARLVRASAEPFAGAFSHLDGRRLTVWRARQEPLARPSLGVPGQVTELRRATGEVAVLAGDGQVILELVELEPPGSGRVPPTEAIQSTRQRLGLDLASELARLRERVAELEDRGG